MPGIQPWQTLRCLQKRLFRLRCRAIRMLWFYVDQALVANYQEAVRLVTRAVQDAMQLREIPGPFDNPEGCDSDFRLEHLQPWETREHRALQHSHAFHLRYYHTALETKQLTRPG